ncbi:DNA replication complex GINS protein PSF3-like [Tripterygium wilfordii]|uniref:DNA replication complex GINS protein PSF3-like n=1 Tax=Tripterygium wilfordii TaxID=458696 RepID=A0A7J7CWK7_TRIWF|nr:DNA replication complex GINS protein PSF3-like [Tripterygium wilfordii]
MARVGMARVLLVCPVVFRKEVNGVKIDDSVEKGFVEAGSRSELPFWLAKELHLRQAVSMSTPACFNQKTRMEIQADAACVDLRSRCPYFYEFGCKIAPLVGDQTIGYLLLSAFKTRYEIILSKAHTATFSASSKLSTILTKEETDLYETAQWSMAAFKKWRTGGPRFQKASILGRKRRSID